MNIKKLHLISGLTLSIFIGIHLLNHLSSLFGAEVHIALMNNLRMVYRNILVESILLLAVLTQIISGLKLFRAKRKSTRQFFEKLHIWSGLYLAFFLVIHVGAVLIGRFILDLDTNFYFGVAGLNSFPFNLFFIPYYALAIMAFFSHIAAIHHQKMKYEVLGLSVEQQSRFILIKGVVVSLLILYGLTNGFGGVEIPEAYHVLIGK